MFLTAGADDAVNTPVDGSPAVTGKLTWVDYTGAAAVTLDATVHAGAFGFALDDGRTAAFVTGAAFNATAHNYVGALKFIAARDPATAVDGTLDRRRRARAHHQSVALRERADGRDRRRLLREVLASPSRLLRTALITERVRRKRPRNLRGASHLRKNRGKKFDPTLPRRRMALSRRALKALQRSYRWRFWSLMTSRPIAPRSR